MSKIIVETRKGNRKVFRPVLNVSRVFYCQADAEAWIVQAQAALRNVYYTGPAVPDQSPIGGRRQVGPNGSRLLDKSDIKAHKRSGKRTTPLQLRSNCAPISV